ncbi:MAG: YicC/YloC family endoribonuclease [Fusobacterium sp. JB021]|nr:YicC/YloC family endoribonuclease [Fusobacterium sp. JB020]MDP0492744.1 YicC/YloC family endoribonuclease [Fusobacterium sp. JB021]MDP0507117.1 YicC/YloC family endoribonuclease [Fusobacterium sp. JB019]
MRSMTGYSKISYQDSNFIVGMEIKSVNNKNLNLKVKIPNSLNSLENKIRSIVGSRISRGSIDLRISFEDRRDIENLYEYDEKICESYLNVLNKMEKDLEEKFSNKIDYLVNNFNVIKKKEQNSNDYEEIIEEQLKVLLDSFILFKKEEGNRLREYFKERVIFIEKNLEIIKKHKEEVVEIYKEKLVKRLDRIKEEIEFSEKDILKEILLFTDKSDISEEVSRLESHLKQLHIELSSNSKTIGKKIDFILQEMFRELNTMGVKSNSYDISKLVVECKAEIEKIREQAMNIE